MDVAQLLLFIVAELRELSQTKTCAVVVAVVVLVVLHTRHSLTIRPVKGAVWATAVPDKKR